MGRGIPRMFLPHRFPHFAFGLAVAALGCGGGGDIVVPPTTGSLEITTSTTGSEQDADGYSVQIDAGPAQPIGVAATLRTPDMSPGNYTVQLSEMAANCTLSGDNPRTVSVTAGETAMVSFAVTCSATTGGLTITAVTTGTSADPDGYAISINGADRGAVGANAAVTISGLVPGIYLVGLSGVAGNCQIQGDNLQAVTITAGANASVAYTISCAAPLPGAGSLRITTATSGADADPDGYVFALDGAPGQPIAPTATTTLPNLAPGVHTVQLAGVAGNCTVQGTNPRTITVTGGATAEVNFLISCSATTGTIAVTVTTSGAPPDPDGYVLTLDGATPGKSIPTGGGSVRFTDVPAGPHSVALTGTAANCSVTGGHSRAVTVTAGATSGLSFAITCAPTTGSIQVTTSTTGPSPDSDGYTLAVDGGAAQTIGVNITTTLTDVAAGSHSVALGGVASNCAITGENPKDVDVQAGGTVTLAFAVSCSPPTLRWRTMASGTSANFSDVWGSSGSHVLAVGGREGSNANVYRYDGQSWSEHLPAPGGVSGVWGSSATDVFGVGFAADGGGLFHYNGSAWSSMMGPVLPEASYDAVWGASSSDVYAVGTYYEGVEEPLVAHYNGTSWSQVIVPTRGDATDVHGTSSRDVYVTGYVFPGDGYFVLRYNGTAWEGGFAESEPGLLLGVWANSPSDVFAVGIDDDGGMIVHYNGQEWSHMDTPPMTGQSHVDVWGTSDSDVYAISSSAIFHYDGTSWTQVFGQGGRAIWGSSSTNVFVVGADGSILHGTP